MEAHEFLVEGDGCAARGEAEDSGLTCCRSRGNEFANFSSKGLRGSLGSREQVVRGELGHEVIVMTGRSSQSSRG